MEKWLQSVYSDGSELFVSKAAPAIGEKVTIAVRMLADSPVRHVMIWSRQNGGQRYDEMKEEEVRGGLVYYRATLEMQEPRLEYRFLLVTDERNYFYTQRGITTYVPGHDTSFVLLGNYHQPEWVKHAVFYQIFPERFANGDPSNDVRDGEYTYFGDKPIHMKHWEDRPLPWEQGHCMDFFGGDLQGIKEKIPYLKKLGVTALYINPIFAAPSTHKYDCIDYFHVDPHFGGDEAFADLCRALHENDMRVILDISINHTGTANRWFNKDGLFFDKSEGAYNNPDSEERNYYFFKPGTNEYKGWWDIETLPTLNFTSESLRRRLYGDKDSVLRKWLRPPYCIDGWRFDVADVMARNGEVQMADKVWPEICAAIREENPGAYIIAEDWDECSERQQGDEWDSPMNYYTCERPVRQFYGESDFYVRQNAVMRECSKGLRAEDMEGQAKEYYARLPFVMQQNQFNLIDSHDVPRFHNDLAVSRKAEIGAAVLQFTMIGTPSIYYGDEAEIGGWTETIEGCRFPMPWSRDIESTEMYRVYHTLIRARHEHPALTDGGMTYLYADGPVIAFARLGRDEAVVTLVSSSKNEETITLPLDIIGAEFVPGTKDVLGQTVRGESSGEGELTVTLEPEGALAFPVKYRV